MQDASRPLGPLLIVVGGWMASGKSSLATALASRIGAALFSADAVRRELHDAGREDAYVPGFSSTLYPEVLRRVEASLGAGAPVVVEGTFRSREMRASAREVARRLDVPFRFVECRAGAETCRSRLRRRQRETGETGWLEMFEAFLRLWEPPEELTPDEVVPVETERSVEATLAALLPRLAVGAAAPAGDGAPA